MRRRADRLAVAVAAVLGGAVAATPVAAAAAPACTVQMFEGQGYTVCVADAKTDDLRLFLTAPDGTALGTFGRVAAAVAPDRLVFAMNAGMYQPDRSPVGLFVANGVQVMPIVTAAGPGNFGMLPNGVFCIGPAGFAVAEARRFAADPPDCRHATQSGPMLVVDGALHPRFMPGSASRYVRNGVGVSADGARAYLVISGGRVNFDTFARFFRDVLRVPNALYLDGNISRLYAPELGRDDRGFPMGPILGLVATDTAN